MLTEYLIQVAVLLQLAVPPAIDGAAHVECTYNPPFVCLASGCRELDTITTDDTHPLPKLTGEELSELRTIYRNVGSVLDDSELQQLVPTGIISGSEVADVAWHDEPVRPIQAPRTKLLKTCRRIDAVSNDLEALGRYDEADQLRAVGMRLRLELRQSYPQPDDR